jgi:NarL family two-component system response regulator LiaR
MDKHGRMRVLVVDDDQSMRRMLSVALPVNIPNVEVVGEAENGFTAISAAEKLQPDLIILDHMMPMKTGAAAVPELIRRSPGSEIIFFTAYVDSLDVSHALQKMVDTYHLEAIPKAGITGLEAAVGRACDRLGFARV